MTGLERKPCPAINSLTAPLQVPQVQKRIACSCLCNEKIKQSSVEDGPKSIRLLVSTMNSKTVLEIAGIIPSIQTHEMKDEDSDTEHSHIMWLKCVLE